jgi:high-affinity iron transporter
VGEAFLITLREGFEAALIVAIVLAAVHRSGWTGMDRWVWAGVGAALALSIAIGAALHLTIDDLTGVARLRTFGVICIAAAGLLTWMIFWMRRHARGLKGELDERIQVALGHSALALAGVAFVAVAREGLETALFLISTTSADDGRSVLVGGVAGLAVAVLLGALAYGGGRRIPMRLFFQVTGVLLILFAAGLLDRAVQFLQAAGDVGTANNAAYDLTGLHWLTVDAESGKFLAGIFGWDPRPSVEQIVVYLIYAVPVLLAFFLDGRRPRPPRAAVESVAQ